jgi:hypothetical protein
MPTYVACSVPFCSHPTGIVVDGYSRDFTEIASILVGVKALHTIPKNSGKKGTGNRNVPCTLAGSFSIGEYLYANQDRIAIAGRGLLNSSLCCILTYLADSVALRWSILGVPLPYIHSWW